MIIIGEGISAHVYSDGEFAYKQYKEGYSLDNMKFEVYVQNQIYEHTNLNVAHYEIVDNKIKMTLLDGLNLADRIIKENYLQGMQDFIDLQLQIFQYKDLKLADSFQTFAYQIKETELDETLKTKALESIDKIKKLYCLCHFDFHPENIVYHKDIPYIIDWTNAKLGNPTMDIASTYVIFRLYAEEFAEPYLEAMLANGFDLSQIVDAIPVMAFIRLRENQEEKLDQPLKDFVLGIDRIFHR
ncbi:MAG: aminoglycoside phosphotransferase family protein [Bacilli bacterium]|nr:aminoglycoside phosphotransferase family protein [Bacilli bacterium]MBN2876864.1 aminoglycoside phosphotransferase family protein [Bacilli bacterium]